MKIHRQLTVFRSVGAMCPGLFLAVLCLAPSACSDATGPGSPTHLTFSVPPGPTVSGSPLAPGIAVSIRDDQGETVAGWTSSVALSLEGGPPGAELLGPGSSDPLVGIALFQGLTISTTGQGFRLRATSGNLEPAVSDPFDVHEVFRASSIRAGNIHTCSLQADGTAHCWGRNPDGRLGTGDDYDRRMPVPVGTAIRLTELSAHQFHTCGLTAEGSVYCWGENGTGALGDGTTDDRHTPVPVQLPGTALSVSAGGYHSCALLLGGEAYCWGRNGGGSLGVESEEDIVLTPSRVKGEFEWTSIDTGYGQVCGLTPTGEAYCWGPNWYGEVGDGTRLQTRSEPTKVLGGHTFDRLIAGGGQCHGQTCGFTEDGTVLCWGKNYQEDLKAGSGSHTLTPDAIVGDPGFTDLFVGPASICGTTGADELFCFGDLNHRIFGLDAEYTQHPLRLVPTLSIADVGIGYNYICIITTGGEAYCWGDNAYGQMGSPGSGLGTFVPTPVWKPFSGS